MNTKNLIYFLQICKDKSLRKAAESKYITPQGLSRMIKSMEDDLQVKLFNRKHDGMELTEYGKVVKKYSQKILNNIDSMTKELEDLKRQNRIDLNIACTYGVASAISPDFLIEYRNSHPEINLNVMEAPDIQIENAISSGESTIGFTIGPVDTDLFDAVLIKTQDLRVLINKSNKISNKDSVSFDDLCKEKFILVNKNFKTYHNVSNRCINAGYEPNIALEVSEISLIHKYVSLNYGIGVTVDYVIEDIKYDNIVDLPFEDETLKWQIYLIAKKGSYLPRVAKDFITYITSMYS